MAATATRTAIGHYNDYLAAIRHRPNRDIARLINLIIPSLMDDSLTTRLAQIDRLKGWLDSFRPLPPSVVAELKNLYDVRFTYNSNAIEGNTLTQSETELVLREGITVGGKRLLEHLEVIGHHDAISYIESLAATDAVLGEWEIRQIHALILRTADHLTGQTDAGRYRTLDVKAAGTEYAYPPHYEIPERMEAFAGWLQSDAARLLHPVVRAAEAHYRFVSVHPLRDGNGRTGRLLMNLLLLRDGYPIAVIPNARRKEYIDSLVFAQSTLDDIGPLTGLVVDACRESLIEYLRVLSTSAESKGRGLPFYDEMLELLTAT